MIKGTVEDRERCLGFAGTQKQANKAVKEISEQCPDITSVYWHPEEIPTNKAGLLSWLNDYGYKEVDEIILAALL